jgi:hypothetical protein
MNDKLIKKPISLKVETWIVDNMKEVRKEGGDSQARQVEKALIKTNKWKRPKAD